MRANSKRKRCKDTSTIQLISNFGIASPPAGQAVEPSLDKRTDRQTQAQGVQVLLCEEQSAALHQLVLLFLAEQWSQQGRGTRSSRSVCLAFIRQRTLHPDICAIPWCVGCRKNSIDQGRQSQPSPTRSRLFPYLPHRSIRQIRSRFVVVLVGRWRCSRSRPCLPALARS